MPDIDIAELLRNTQSITQYPMIDRDPLPWWTQGRVTLLGDAAHPMYPMGANGASQAIIDARVLADMLEQHPGPQGLHAYEDIRRPITTDVVLNNRKSGPEQVLDIAAARIKGPDDRIEDRPLDERGNPPERERGHEQRGERAGPAPEEVLPHPRGRPRGAHGRGPGLDGREDGGHRGVSAP